ncbi:MAG TPA: hypothetical protein VLF94_01140 [Chlamydiales bacterium]|nr:hypothetical protein [Chlamydiales bacterium]
MANPVQFRASLPPSQQDLAAPTPKRLTKIRGEIFFEIRTPAPLPEHPNKRRFSIQPRAPSAESVYPLSERAFLVLSPSSAFSPTMPSPSTATPMELATD